MFLPHLKIKFIHFFWFFFYLFIFLMLFKGASSYLDPDFGWHLAVGQEIEQTSQVPRLNHYNYTYTGSWVDHEWLSNYLIATVYQAFGYQAILAISALLIVLVFILLHIFTRHHWPSAASPGLIAVVEIFALLAAWPHFGVRIQQLALLFLLLLLLWLFYYDRYRNWLYLLPLPILFYFWANLHASFLLGLAVFLFWLGVKVFVALLRKTLLIPYFDDKPLKSLEFGTAALFFLLSLAATLLTPYRFELYAFLSGYQNVVYQSYIMEWLSQFSYPFYYWQLLYLSLVAASLVLSIYRALGRSRRPLNLWQFALTFVLLIFSFKSRRHFPLLVVVSFPWLIHTLADWLGSGGLSFKRWPWWLRAYVIVCLLMAGFLQAWQINFSLRPQIDFHQDYPVRAVAFLRQNPHYQDLRIFNEYVWGGYLIWAYPEKPLFIDGRLPQADFAGHTFLEEYLEFMGPKADYEAKLEEYNISLVLLKAKNGDLSARRFEKYLFQVGPADLERHNYLREYLETSANWSRIYSDATAVIYLRRNYVD